MHSFHQTKQVMFFLVWQIAMASFLFLISGVRQEQDIYVRLIDSVTKQVSPIVECYGMLASVIIVHDVAVTNLGHLHNNN